MRKTVWWLIVLFGAGVLGAIVYNALKKPPPAVPQPAPAAAPAAPQPEPPAAPQVRYPVEQPAPEKPLPALDVSDSTLRAELDAVLAEKSLLELFLLRDFIRRVVATVDNLPRGKVAQRLLPVKPVGGAFPVTGQGTSLAIGADNAQRYQPFMRLVNAVDTAKLVALYARYYPLFQQAYRDLGYPRAHFNDRLVEVIDHLLGAPEVAPGARLVRPKVFYLYADPELEAQSAGRKVLMRIGSGNAAVVKAKLKELRAALTQLAPRR